MKLYYAPGACSLAPHIALREADLAFELEPVDLATGRTAGGADFRTINPRGYVPALALSDGEVLTECAAVLQYVADLAPDRALAPAAGSRARVHLQAWLSYITAELHKTLGPLFRPDLPDGFRDFALAAARPRLDLLDRHLRGQAFLLDDAFTVADAYAFAVLGWAAPLAIDLTPWDALGPYRQRIAARPAVAQALAAEGLTDSAAA